MVARLGRLNEARALAVRQVGGDVHAPAHGVDCDEQQLNVGGDTALRVPPPLVQQVAVHEWLEVLHAW